MPGETGGSTSGGSSGGGSGSSSSRRQQRPQRGLEFMGSTDLDASGRREDRRREEEPPPPRSEEEGFDDDDAGVGNDDDFSVDLSCAVSVGSSANVSEESPAAPAIAAAPVAVSAPSAPATMPASYSGPFSSAAAATAAAPVVAKTTAIAGVGSGVAPAVPPKAASSAQQQGGGGGVASSSWKSDWDREEQHHALTKALGRHRQALHDTYKLRDAGRGAAAGGAGGTAVLSASSGAAKAAHQGGSGGVMESSSEYDSDDTARSEATEKTGMVGGPGIVPPTGGGGGIDDDDTRSLETKSISSAKGAGAAAAASASAAGAGTVGSGGSGASRIIQPRADVMGARGLMAKRKKTKAEAKGGYYGAGAKGPAGVAASAEAEKRDEDDRDLTPAPKDSSSARRQKFAFIGQARGSDPEGQDERRPARGLLRRRGHKRKGETLHRCALARRACVALLAVAAVVAAALGTLLPNTAAGQSVRSAARETGTALRVAVSGTEGADTPAVDFAEAKKETAALQEGRTSAAEREKALPQGNRMRRDEQMDKKRTADAMLAARGQGGTGLVADHYLNTQPQQSSAVQSTSSQRAGAGPSSLHGRGQGGGLGEDSYALAMGGGGGGGFRNLGLLHSSGQYRGLAHPGAAGANVLPQYGGITSPSVLPPLEDYNTKRDASGEGIYIPRTVTRNYADVWDAVTRLDMPLFWKVPRSGGRTVQAVLGKCLGAVQASEMGKRVAARFFRSKTLTVHSDEEGLRYVNVDTTDAAGLRRAKRLGASSVESFGPDVDVFVSPLFHDSSEAFDEVHRGRAFALFRHPVKRVASTYFSLRDDDSDEETAFGGRRDEALVQKVRAMSVLEYARSDLSDENFVVRSLTQDFEGQVTARHVEVAKEVVRRKVLVGITEAFEESMVRFERYLGWWDVVADNEEVLRCQGETAAASDGRYRRPHQVHPGTAEFQALAAKNWADLELYDYAKTLFQEQASLV